MSDKLPPCDHDKCPPTHCLKKEPTELQKAIERVKDWSTRYPGTSQDFNVLIAAAKQLELTQAQVVDITSRLGDAREQLKEVTEERDDWYGAGIAIAALLACHGCKANGIAEGVKELIGENTALKADYKQALEAISKIKPPQECPWCSKQDVCPECLHLASLQGGLAHVLKLPSAIAIMKGEA